jgi:GNAT superfamily N-acetyltransferase
MRDWAAASPGGPIESAQSGSAVALRSAAFPVRELNRIVGLYDLATLDELAPLYEGESFWVALDPEAGLDDALQARAFVPDYAWQKFERGLEPVDAHTELRVVDAESPADFGTAFAQGYGLPPALGDFAANVVGRPSWHCFVAYDGGEPVGVGAIFESGDAGWLGAAATLPSQRGRGAQGAILAARVQRARERVLVTETRVPRGGQPGASYRNISEADSGRRTSGRTTHRRAEAAAVPLARAPRRRAGEHARTGRAQA